ncbi:sulfurtransferase TusA family protein [Sphingomonas sp. ac-8]|uniref:sulfurtransferase TusA family protein n=1 Tax=Sphingomonas sp. ac-8 TaxID=3242977 RepID=UPI003A800B6E
MTLDARGLRCPWPALRLARALRTGEQGARFEVLADDPNAEREMRAVAEAAGRTLAKLDNDRFEVAAAA